MKILLVEDDEAMASAITDVLVTHHYLVTVAQDGRAGVQLAESGEYDLIVLDVVLPELDGLSLCRQLRNQGNSVPILLLTAQASSHDRVTGLDAGADDYLIKPFDFAEFLARIRALLRRGGGASSPIITHGNLRFDPSANEFTYQDKPLRLTRKEYLLLELFLMNPRRVFSRGVILDRLWTADEFPGEETVTTHVKSLRQRLKSVGAPTNLIETVYGLGYRLKPLTELEQENDSNPSEFRSPHTPDPLAEAPSPKAQSSKAQSPPASPASDLSSRQRQTVVAVEQLRQKFQSSFMEQVEELERMAIEATHAQLSPERYQQAKQIAHKLAGSLGTFGYEQGSHLARDIENLLQISLPLEPTQATCFLDWAKQLHYSFRQPPSAIVLPSDSLPAIPQKGETAIKLLVIDDDEALTEQIQAAATAWNWQVNVAANPSIARQILTTFQPDTILLDLTFPNAQEDGLILLRQLSQQYANVPVVVFTGRGSLNDRIEVAQLGGRAFLQKPVSLEQIFSTVTQELQQLQTVEAKVMAVDDDPAILELIRHLLEQWGLAVMPLTQSERFWDALEAFAPDLLILDVEMPKINGIQLCQVVRNDPGWAELPVLMLSAHTDAETRYQVFTSGADDYIQKPIVEPELVARVINRLERSRLYRRLLHPAQSPS